VAREPLVLIPGLLCSPALWAPQVAALSAIADIRIGDHTQHESMAGIAASILAQAPDRFALAGLSMGGYIAFEIMRQAPERVTKLALLDTLAVADTPERRAGRHDLIALAEKHGLERVMEKLIPLFIHTDRLSDAALVAVVQGMARDTGVAAFKRQQMAIISRPDSRPTLATIRCPTLLLVGRDDVLTPVVAHEEMAAAIPGSRLTIIENCGHLSTLEQPAAVNAALLTWLS
jgi:pimeloyl-ACP methyl ester carboxylesterase